MNVFLYFLSGVEEMSGLGIAGGEAPIHSVESVELLNLICPVFSSAPQVSLILER